LQQIARDFAIALVVAFVSGITCFITLTWMLFSHIPPGESTPGVGIAVIYYIFVSGAFGFGASIVFVIALMLYRLWVSFDEPGDGAHGG